MKYILPALFITILLSFKCNANSNDAVLVRMKALPEEPLVGQKVVVTLDVLGRDGWATVKSFPLLEVAGAYLHRYETQGTRLNETKNGESYSGQRYEFLLFPYSDGELKVDSVPLEVTVKKWGASASTATEKVTTPELQFKVSSPEGVQPGSQIPVTSRMNATQAWSSRKKEYSAGDVVERKITRSAEDVSAMYFKPYDVPVVAGMRCYSDQPKLNDSFDRGVLKGTRVDSFSCIFEKPGTFTFPEITFRYWNVTKGKVEEIVLSEASFEVVKASHGQESSATQLVTNKSYNVLIYILLLSVVISVSVFLFRRQLSDYIKRKHAERLSSEPFLFNQLGKVLQRGKGGEGGGKQEIVASIMCWLDHLPGLCQPVRLDSFAEKYGNKKLITLLNDLSFQKDWSREQGKKLYMNLQATRKNYFKQRKAVVAAETSLPTVGLDS